MCVCERERGRGEKIRRICGHYPPPPPPLSLTHHTFLSFSSSTSSYRPLILNKKPDANACKVLEDWISSLSFSSPGRHSFGPFCPSSSFFYSFFLYPYSHLSRPRLTTFLKLKMCRRLGFGAQVYFGAVIKFIAWHTHTHIPGQGNHTTVYSGLLLYYLKTILHMCSTSTATPYFVTLQQYTVFIHSKLSIHSGYILHSQLWG